MSSERRIHARGNAQHERENGGAGRQLERGGQAFLQQCGDGSSLPQREPELAAQRALDKARELHVEGLVEPDRGAQLGALLLRGVLPDHEGHRISGEVEQSESDERDHQHHEGGLHDAAENEGEQGSFALGGATRARRPAMRCDDAESALRRQRISLGDPRSAKSFNSAARRHATRTLPKDSSAGTSLRQRSMACGQRVWKGQPGGGLRGEGSSPFTASRSRRALPPREGVLASSAFVYGCAGRSKIASLGPSSTTLPRYITKTASAMCRTTCRLCEMKR